MTRWMILIMIILYFLTAYQEPWFRSCLAPSSSSSSISSFKDDPQSFQDDLGLNHTNPFFQWKQRQTMWNVSPIC